MAVEFQAATQVTAPVANTTAGKWTFAPGVSTLSISNWTGQTIYVRVNSASAATASVFDRTFLNNASEIIRLSDWGVHDVDTVSVWMPTSATVGNFILRGI